MEEEIEDIVGDVKLTDSQKSVATSNVYSMDFTDSSSDKNHSSGKDTYVIGQFDSDDSDSYVPVHRDESVIDLDAIRKNRDANVQCDTANKIFRAASTSVQNCSIVAQEIFTQTSKTIFELARTNAKQETLETQTSFISIQENHTYEYRIEVSNTNSNGYATVLTNASEEQSSKYHASSSETVKSDGSDMSSKDVVHILDTGSKENILTDDTQNDTQYENMSEFDESNDSDIEQDSLIETKSPSGDSETEEARKIADLEIADLYNKIAESREREGIKCYRPLTPLTEESTKKESATDVESESKKIENLNENVDKNILFTSFTGGVVKMLPKEEEGNEFKLPPIRNRSCPNSPHLDFLFTVQPSDKLDKPGTLPCLFEGTESYDHDRWEIKNKSLASGESAFISSLSESTKDTTSIHLPPIHIEGYVVNSKITKIESAPIPIYKPLESECDAISIKERIKELKIPRRGKMRSPTRSESRSGTPVSDEEKAYDATERGCDALCVDLLRRMRSSSWFEISDTMADIPKVLDKFWNVIAEHRIADLIRQVSLQVDSPRTQVARAGCNTLACILKKTKYTKKPDFNEAIALLLTKTGSFSRPVRRAANVALDGVVCGVDLSHSVTALCVHGVEHKSPLVRCAAARLLVVSCALCGGGRGLLRARPPSAAVARRHALRSLSLLLDDKSTDTRKYAERLYAMLRPLANFEAYYLTDVDVDLAARQMKKYDRLLLFPKDGR